MSVRCRTRRSVWWLAALFPLILSAQDTAWMTTRYTTEQGLPQNSVRNLHMDTAGYLWLTTEGGVLRFDGQRFRMVAHHPTTTGPVTSRMRTLVPTADGCLFVADARGNHFQITEELHLVSAMDGLHLLYIEGALPSRKAMEWLVRSIPESMAWDPWQPEPLQVFTLDDMRWCKVIDGEWSTYKDTLLVNSRPMPEGTERIFMLDGYAYTFTEKNEVLAFDEESEEWQPTTVVGSPDVVGSTDKVGIHWRSGADRAHLVVGRRLYRLERRESLGAIQATDLGLELPTNTRVTTLWADVDEDLVMFGTNSKGLFAYRRQWFDILTCGPLTGGSDSYYAQLPMPGGRSFTVEQNYSTRTIGPEGCTTPTYPLDEVHHEGLMRDRSGGMWFTRRDSVFRLDPASGELRFICSNLGPGAIFLEEGDSVWVGNVDRIGVVNDKGYRILFDLPQPGLKERLFAIKRAPWGELLFATCHGLFVLDTAGRAGLRPMPAFQGLCVRALGSLEGRIFVGTYGDGAYILDQQRSVPIPMDPQGVLSHAHSFELDADRVLWISTNRGLIRMDMDDLLQILDDPDHEPYHGYYGRHAWEGSTEFNGGTSPSHVRLDNGRLSYPTMEGLLQFDPMAIRDPFPRAAPRVDRMLVDDVPMAHNGLVELPASVRTVVLEFSLPYWGDPSNALLEYRVGGEGDDWIPIPLGMDRITIARPKPGKMTVELRKRNGAWHQDTRVAQVILRIDTPWYLTFWAAMLYTVAFMSTVLLVAEWRSRQLLKANQELEARVRDRTARMEQLNRELRHNLRNREQLLSILSHDVVTPLRFLARVAHSAIRMRHVHGNDLDDTLRDLSMTADKLYGHANNLVGWARHQQGSIQPRPASVAVHPLAEDTLSLVEEMATIKGIILENAVNVEDLVVTDPNVLNIILSNLVTNAVVHNDAPCQVTVSGNTDGSNYVLEVRDAGKDMSTHRLGHIRALLSQGEQAMDPASAGNSGLGYVIIRELATVIDAKVTVDSDARGTVARITLPVRPSALVKA